MSRQMLSNLPYLNGNSSSFNGPMNQLILTVLVAIAVGLPVTAMAQDIPVEYPPAGAPDIDPPEPTGPPTPAVASSEDGAEGTETDSSSSSEVVEVKESVEVVETPAKPVVSQVVVSDQEFEVREDPLKEEIKEYWSTEGRELSTVDKRLFDRNERFEAALYLGVDPSATFFWYLNVGARLTYHFTQVHGLEFAAAYQLSFEKGFTKYIKNKTRSFDPVKVDDQGVFRADVVYVWRPLYGKFGLFSKKLAHFDWNLAAGIGINGVNRPEKGKVKFAVEPEITFGTGFSVFIFDGFNLRFDARGFITRGAETPDKKTYFERIHFPFEVTLGAAYLF